MANKKVDPGTGLSPGQDPYDYSGPGGEYTPLGVGQGGSTLGGSPDTPPYGAPAPPGLPGTAGSGKGVDPKTSGNQPTGAGFAASPAAENLLKTFPSTPSTQQDINKVLQPYMNELLNLGPEYGQEMSYLAPYLSPEHQTFQSISAQSQANESPSGDKGLEAAEQAQANAINSEPAPGFGNLAKGAEQYESSLLYQQPVTAALAYQKYLQSYGGQPPATADWPQSIKDAYSAIGGASSSTGLQSPATAATDAAASANAQQVLTGSQPPSTPGQ